MNISISYGYTIKDHIIVKFELIQPHQETYFENASTDLESTYFIDTYQQLNKASDSDVLEYIDNLESRYNDKLYESLLCYDLNSKDISHVKELSSIYRDILINIELAS